VIQREEKTFELDPGEVASARWFVAGVLKGWGCDSDDVTLAVGELASNAVLHARTHFTVILSLSGEQLTVAVVDHNPRLPVAVAPPPGAVSGRGLMLVEAVSNAWGVSPVSTGGKLVWAEFRVAETSAAIDPRSGRQRTGDGPRNPPRPRGTKSSESASNVSPHRSRRTAAGSA
jgi:hypothetical protein